jgi:hypothetical protein
MKRTVWRALLCSFVLFLLSCAACDHGTRQVCRAADAVPVYGVEDCGWYIFGSGWEGLGAVLFVASVSVAAGGAMRWWHESVVGETDLRAPLLELGAASKAEATEGIRDAAAEEAPARLSATPTPTPYLYEPPRAHFDEHGRSPLERVLAEK